MTKRPPLMLAPVNLLRQYHRHHVTGLKNIPQEGGALIVTNHSFATYDCFMLGAAILEHRARLVRALGDRMLFKIPGLRGLLSDAGVVPAGMDTARKLLQDGNLLGITPGGMREALRSSRERFQIRWGDRKGFVRLSILSRCPILLAACPEADKIFDVTTGAITDFAYKNFHLPIAFVKGWGPLPRPVQLTHRVGKPLLPPKTPKSKVDLESVVDEWHAELTKEMQTLMGSGPANTAASSFTRGAQEAMR